MERPDADPHQATASQFYDRAFWQLANASARCSSLQQPPVHGESLGYTEAEALAALHLVAYFLMQGGVGDWPAHLDVAREWLVQTGLPADNNEDPKQMLMRMSDAAQLAAKVTIVSRKISCCPSFDLLLCACRSISHVCFFLLPL